MTRADRVRTMADGYISPKSVRHVLAAPGETACGHAAVYPEGNAIDSYGTCGRCVEAVVHERTRYLRAQVRAWFRRLLRRSPASVQR